tara:strand:+ start:33300 stop:35591 length:2292 start_codon:yes stop_codon:yes gene_type:complete
MALMTDIQKADILANCGNDIPLLPVSPNRTIYVAVDGLPTNSGLTISLPIDIMTAFSSSFVESGDLYYIKAGNYQFPLNPSNNRQINLSNLPSSLANPIYWIGYKNTPNDINATNYATVTWSDYKARPRSTDLTHVLDSSVMPTFSGSVANRPSYIQNESLFWQDGGESGFVFRNIQIQYFRYAFEFRNLTNSVFENVVVGNLGQFAPVSGQGGINQDLIGKAFSMTQRCDNLVIKNCACYNMAMTAFSLGEGYNSLIEYCKAYSDIDNGNPQDYYFHTIGKNSVFRNLEAHRLISSNHSGHGICFNQKSELNIMLDSYVYGTNIHFDGAVSCYADGIDLVGVVSYALYDGGGISIYDNAEYNHIKNVTSLNSESAISFSDSGKNSYDEHPGRNNFIENFTVTNARLCVIDFNWWNEVTDVCADNEFLNLIVNGSPSLFLISRSNSGTKIISSTINNVPQLARTNFKNSGSYFLNSNTEFRNVNFVNSEVPNSSSYIVVNDGIPFIILNGNSYIEIPLGGSYVELGAVYDDVEDGIGSATVGGDSVNTSVKGVYLVTYNFTDSNGNVAPQVVRTVSVSPDNARPVLTLVGSSVLNLSQFDDYIEFGCSATDLVDGDLTSQIVISGLVDTDVIGTYYKYYNVTDSNGFVAFEVVRQINVGNIDAFPVLDLNGSSVVDNLIGFEYVELGATAIDVEDGDLTSQIVITGSVDFTTLGNYDIFYSITDSNGNTSQIKRTVRVIETHNDNDLDIKVLKSRSANVLLMY